MKKFLSLILAVFMALSLAACGKGDNDTPTDAPTTTPPEIIQPEKDPIDVPKKLASTPEEWSPDLIDPRMAEVVQIVYDGFVGDMLDTSVGSDGVWMTAKPTTKEATKIDALSIEGCDMTAMFINLLEDLRDGNGLASEPTEGLENFGKGAMPWSSSNELAQLFGFTDAGVMHDAGVGTTDLMTYIFSGLAEAFGGSDSSSVQVADLEEFAPEFSSFFGDYCFNEEGDADIVCQVDDLVIFRNDEHAILDISDSGAVLPLRRGDDLYYVAVCGAGGHSTFGDTTVSVYLYKTLEDGTYYNKTISLHADWDALLDRADELGGILRENDPVIMLDAPILVVSEKAMLEGVGDFSVMVEGLTGEYDWWPYDVESPAHEGEDSEMTPEEEAQIRLLAEYLGIDYETIQDGIDF